MNLADFNAATRKVWNTGATLEHNVSHALLGIATKIGDIANEYRKKVGERIAVDETLMVHHLGQMHFYISRIIDDFKMDLNELDRCTKEVPIAFLKFFENHEEVCIQSVHQQYSQLMFALAAFTRNEEKAAENLYRRCAEFLIILEGACKVHGTTLIEIRVHLYETQLESFWDKFKRIFSKRG